jgi:hypothetical protein
MTYNHLDRLLQNQSSTSSQRLNSRVISTVFFGSTPAANPSESTGPSDLSFDTTLDSDDVSSDSFPASLENVPAWSDSSSFNIQNRHLAEPLEVTFVHLTPTDGTSTSVRCVHWIPITVRTQSSSSPSSLSGQWSPIGCHLMRTNRTHSNCRCRVPGHFALQLYDASQSSNDNQMFAFGDSNLPSVSSLPPATDPASIMSVPSSAVSSSSSANHPSSGHSSSSSVPHSSVSKGMPFDAFAATARVSSTHLRHVVRACSVLAAICLLYTFAVLITVSGDNSELLTICRHLCFSLAIVQILLATGGVGQSLRPLLCSFVFSALHFTLMAALLWTFLLTFDLYLSALDVHEPVKNARRPLCYYALAYVGSAVVLLVTWALDAAPLSPASFGSTGVALLRAAPAHCWIDLHSYLCFTFVGPAGGVLLCSFLFLGIVRHVLGGSCASGMRLLAGGSTCPSSASDYNKCALAATTAMNSRDSPSGNSAAPVVAFAHTLKGNFGRVSPTAMNPVGGVHTNSASTTLTNTTGSNSGAITSAGYPSGTMLHTGTSGTVLTTSGATHAYEIQRRPAGHELRSAARLTWLLLLLQCVCWAAGTLHVAQPNSIGWALLFAFAQPALAMFILLYTSLRISSMEHHRCAPHLRLARQLRTCCMHFGEDHCEHVSHLASGSGPNAAVGPGGYTLHGGALNGRMMGTLGADHSGHSLTQSNSLCLSNSKSAQPLYGGAPCDGRTANGSLYGSNYGFGSMTPVYQQPMYQPLYQQVGNSPNSIISSLTSSRNTATALMTSNGSMTAARPMPIVCLDNGCAHTSGASVCACSAFVHPLSASSSSRPLSHLNVPSTTSALNASNGLPTSMTLATSGRIAQSLSTCNRLPANPSSGTYSALHALHLNAHF